MRQAGSRGAGFSLLVWSAADARCARLLIESLRAFGGPLGGAPVSVFVSSAAFEAGDLAAIDDATLVPLEIDDTLGRYPFGAKVLACARRPQCGLSS